MSGARVSPAQPVTGTYAHIAQLEQQLADARRAYEELYELVNTPEVENFVEAVRLEAAHQVQRWGEAHDQGKTPEDWMWVLAFLATKATQAARYGDKEKYLHHIVTSAALCLNWHRAAMLEAAGNGN
jgi:hypothetical protein